MALFTELVPSLLPPSFNITLTKLTKTFSTSTSLAQTLRLSFARAHHPSTISRSRAATIFSETLATDGAMIWPYCLLTAFYGFLVTLTVTQPRHLIGLWPKTIDAPASHTGTTGSSYGDQFPPASVTGIIETGIVETGWPWPNVSESVKATGYFPSPDPELPGSFYGEGTEVLPLAVAALCITSLVCAALFWLLRRSSRQVVELRVRSSFDIYAVLSTSTSEFALAPEPVIPDPELHVLSGLVSALEKENKARKQNIAALGRRLALRNREYRKEVKKNSGLGSQVSKLQLVSERDRQEHREAVSAKKELERALQGKKEALAFADGEIIALIETCQERKDALAEAKLALQDAQQAAKTARLEQKKAEDESDWYRNEAGTVENQLNTSQAQLRSTEKQLQTAGVHITQLEEKVEELEKDAADMTAEWFDIPNRQNRGDNTEESKEEAEKKGEAGIEDKTYQQHQPESSSSTQPSSPQSTSDGPSGSAPKNGDLIGFDLPSPSENSQITGASQPSPSQASSAPKSAISSDTSVSNPPDSRPTSQSPPSPSKPSQARSSPQPSLTQQQQPQPNARPAQVVGNGLNESIWAQPQASGSMSPDACDFRPGAKKHAPTTEAKARRNKRDRERRPQHHGHERWLRKQANKAEAAGGAGNGTVAD